MENNDEVTVDDPFEGIEECSIKIECQDDQDVDKYNEDHLDFGLGVNDLETENSKPFVTYTNVHKLNKLSVDTKQSPVFMLHYNSNLAERNLALKYRPIRPKPCVDGNKSGKLKNKLVDIPPAHVSVLNRSNPIIMNGNMRSIHHDKNGTYRNHDKNEIHGIQDKNRILRKNKSKATIELFFDSMAQTVSKLPAKVQAEIKMEICKLVTRAEIKYYGSQLK